jgi:hypothetical protein
MDIFLFNRVFLDFITVIELLLHIKAQYEKTTKENKEYLFM